MENSNLENSKQLPIKENNSQIIFNCYGNVYFMNQERKSDDSIENLEMRLKSVEENLSNDMATVVNTVREIHNEWSEEKAKKSVDLYSKTAKEGKTVSFSKEAFMKLKGGESPSIQKSDDSNSKMAEGEKSLVFPKEVFPKLKQAEKKPSAYHFTGNTKVDDNINQIFVRPAPKFVPKMVDQIESNQHPRCRIFKCDSFNNENDEYFFNDCSDY